MTIEANLADATDEDISALAVRCMDALSLDQRVQAVLKAFSVRDDRDELVQWLNDEPMQEEEEDDSDLGDEDEESETE